MPEKPVARIVAEVPRDLKRRAASKAALEGKSLKDALIEALEQWLAQVEKPQQVAP